MFVEGMKQLVEGFELASTDHIFDLKSLLLKWSLRAVYLQGKFSKDRVFIDMYNISNGYSCFFFNIAFLSQDVSFMSLPMRSCPTPPCRHP